MIRIARAALLAFTLALSISGAPPAHAQISEVVNTPRATVNGTTIGIWAYYAGELGWVCFDIYTRQADGWHGGYMTPNQCIDPSALDSEIAAAGGADNWITAKLPVINAGIKRAIGVVGSPTPTGSSGGDAINASLSTHFTFQTAPDGTTTLVHR